MNILGVWYKLIGGKVTFNLHQLMTTFLLLFFFFFFFGGVNTYPTSNHMLREASIYELIMLVIELNSKVCKDICQESTKW